MLKCSVLPTHTCQATGARTGNPRVKFDAKLPHSSTPVHVQPRPAAGVGQASLPAGSLPRLPSSVAPHRRRGNGRHGWSPNRQAGSLPHKTSAPARHAGREISNHPPFRPAAAGDPHTAALPSPATPQNPGLRALPKPLPTAHRHPISRPLKLRLAGFQAKRLNRSGPSAMVAPCCQSKL